jgi:hypothetical protein
MEKTRTFPEIGYRYEYKTLEELFVCIWGMGLTWWLIGEFTLSGYHRT